MIDSNSDPWQASRNRGLESLRSIRHVIVDRDGVLNQESDGYAFVADPDNFRWLPGVLDALAGLHSLGVRVSVATNQSGVGRGIMSEQALKAVHQKMSSEAKIARASIDAIFYCPHPPNAACGCRKPAPGLIVRAIAESGISADHTLVIGDADRDLDAAQSAGVHAALVRTGKGRLHESYATAIGIPVFDDLSALVGTLASHATALRSGAVE
jgi:D-glycero-D-manno-heptose 1,7-bisphosphate phosphatase